MKVHRRYFARKDLITKIHSDLSAISEEYEKLIQDQFKVEVLEVNYETGFILINGSLLIFKTTHGFFPTVRGALLLDNKRRFVTVDTGAIPFITNGADIMRPGIVNYDPKLNVGEYVVIIEEKYGKALAIGQTLCSGPELSSKKNGKCVKNIHYVGDELWCLG
jgi:PUA domain protein